MKTKKEVLEIIDGKLMMLLQSSREIGFANWLWKVSQLFFYVTSDRILTVLYIWNMLNQCELRLGSRVWNVFCNILVFFSVLANTHSIKTLTTIYCYTIPIWLNWGVAYRINFIPLWTYKTSILSWLRVVWRVVS